MKKLTTEQADWLIKIIDNLKYNDAGLVVNDYYALEVHKIKKLIKKCTEREFPKLKLKSEDGDILIVLEASVFDDNFNAISFLFSNKHEGAANGLLYPEEFKQFTQGCVKICDWLQEQE